MLWNALCYDGLFFCIADILYWVLSIKTLSFPFVSLFLSFLFRLSNKHHWETAITPFSLAIVLVKIHTRLISSFLVTFYKSKLPLVKLLVKLRPNLSSCQLEQSVVDLYWPYSSMKDWENLTCLLPIRIQFLCSSPYCPLLGDPKIVWKDSSPESLYVPNLVRSIGAC